MVGLLVPIWSLYNEGKVGDLGECSRNFLKFLHHADLHYWLTLPLNPSRVDRRLVLLRTLQYLRYPVTEVLPTLKLPLKDVWYDACPYIPSSAFALNPVYLGTEDISTILHLSNTTVTDTPTTTTIPPPPTTTSSHVEFHSQWMYKIDVVSVWYRHLTTTFESESFIWAFRDALAGKKIESDEEAQWVGEFLDFVSDHATTWLTQYAAFETMQDRESLKWAMDDGCVLDKLGSGGFVPDWQKWPMQTGSLETVLAMIDNLTLWTLDGLLHGHRVRCCVIQAMIFHCFTQYLLHQQMMTLKQTAHTLGIKLIGDVPIYLPLQSADCWGNPDLFELNKDDFQADMMTGLPPDFWSPIGQLWGTPVYKWSSEKLWEWWQLRFLRNLELADMLRVDHFRAFADYWAIPRAWAEEHHNGMGGKWYDGPGWAFFDEFFRRNPRLSYSQMIVEDLGELTPALAKIREQMKFDRMEVFQFDVDGISDENSWMNGGGQGNVVAFTGTHDNPSLNEWLAETATSSQKDKIGEKLGRVCLRINQFPRYLISYLAQNAKVRILIIPVQDVLCLGKESRINRPGESFGTLWKWQMNELQYKQLMMESNWLKSIASKRQRGGPPL